ncbi:MAG: DUF72 domain-containing protein [Deltaproteobacteria bacterium]|nr:DUF72 domain-containing protein [Deltaproteobacteria bacterium]
MKIDVGTSGYGYKEWKGIFYPEKITAGEMLPFYAERLHAVEINNTFYRMPTEPLLRSWAAQVPDNFVFVLKAPQVITHRKRLKNAERETAHFFEMVPALAGKAGPVLFQFPANFRADLTVLGHFSTLIPGDRLCAFEFRSPAPLDPGIVDLLREKRHCVVVSDTDERPAGEIVPTASWGYLRLRRSDYGEADLNGWRERIGSQPWQRAFVFFKHEEKARGPEMAMRFQELIRTAGGPEGMKRQPIEN